MQPAAAKAQSRNTKREVFTIYENKISDRWRPITFSQLMK
jgi:hypothetical protein